jgi:hypothetical protein
MALKNSRTLGPVLEENRNEQENQDLKKCVVPRRGLEPPRLAALVPETSASTNSATWAPWQQAVGCRDNRERRRYGAISRLSNARALVL